jgi:geranyl-CoA carboxylase alpha subunit
MSDTQGRGAASAPAQPFDTLLIANRGEIACRVIRTARAMGLRTVAVYSDADRDALHVRMADSAARIGAAPARDSYLGIDRILDACRLTGAQAVHPGYGFLSENADFARACREAGIVFVGPPPEAIDALGNKSAAKRLAQRIGVPCLPGYSGADQSVDTLLEQARHIGPPLMIKAAAGGGGRGMRRCDNVHDTDALRGLLEAARGEALSSFGNGDLLLERLVEQARHVEIQVFGDQHGNYVHLGERDCSTQRRNQKILEEAPAPGVDAALRDRMGEAAVRLAREVGYVGAGTIEFLMAPDGQFYFLEMNTRLQVEHPVTEAITGLDLVEWQLRVARGEPLPRAQDAITWTGHAIEARVCAEDAFGGFVPQIGTVIAWEVPALEGVRLDHGLTARPEVSPHYDSMVAKVIAAGVDREQARRRLITALRATTVLGVGTNRDYLVRCLEAPEFVAPRLATRWLTDASGAWRAPAVDGRWLAVAGTLLLHRAAAPHGALALWTSMAERRTPMRIEVDGTTHAIDVRYNADRPVTVQVGEQSFALQVMHEQGIDWELMIDGRHEAVRFAPTEVGGWLDGFGVCAALRDQSQAPPDRAGGSGGGTILCRMHGQLVKLAVAAGQKVAKGEFLLAIEAMKMEHRIDAPLAGTVVEIGATAGTQVAPGRVLLRIEPDAA